VDNRTLDLNVCQVPSAHEFVVSEFEFCSARKAFVYGRQVSDFDPWIMTSSSAPESAPSRNSPTK